MWIRKLIVISRQETTRRDDVLLVRHTGRYDGLQGKIEEEESTEVQNIFEGH